ncbi:hypothetical protein SBRCBS47491_009118 [Sporothrix bragantina]|uniref:3-hydroxyisobutyrate dehydrogenase n=1 Tax=Sporothrix bragantina TaxID=671064 RepID=A0ABP0CT09_9PEZI
METTNGPIPRPADTRPSAPNTAADSTTRYGFIGIGVMGWGMANNLRAKLPQTDTLVVCEINTERLEQWVAQAPPGPVSVASTPREVAEQSSGLLLCDTPPSPSLPRNKLFIECSTIDVETSKKTANEVRQSAASKGVNYDFVDAPVSGGVNGASTGTLSFMVGAATAALFERARPILALMGKPDNIFHCGDVGSGLATKQINNYLSCITMIGTCEAMNMGLKSGLDPAKLASVIAVSTGACYNCGDQNPVRGVSSRSSAEKDFAAGFTTEMAKGVLDMALSHGKTVGAKSLLGGTVSDFYEMAAGHDKCKGKDFRSIWRLFSEDDGKDIVSNS